MKTNDVRTGAKIIYFQVMKYLLMVFCIPFFVILVEYAELTRNLEMQVYQKNFYILQNGAENMEKTLDNLENLTVFFEYSQDFLNFYYRLNPMTTGKGISDILKAQKNLHNMGIANSDILNIQMYAAKSGVLIDSSSCALYPKRYYGARFRIAGYDYERWVEEILSETEKSVCFEGEMSFQGSTRDVLIYNNEYANDYSGYGNNRIIFYVDKQNLLRAFNIHQYEEGFLAVIDHTGQIILADGVTQAGEQYLLNTEFSEKAYSTCIIEGRKMFLVSYHSDLRGYTYIYAVPYSEISASTKPLANTMKWLVVLAGVFGTILVVHLSARFSNPFIKAHRIMGTAGRNISLSDFMEKLTDVVKKNEVMEKEMRKQLELMQHDALKNMILGNVSEKSEIDFAIAKSKLTVAADHYVLLLLRWNDLDDDISMEEISAQKVYVEGIIQKQKADIELIVQPDMEKTVFVLSYIGYDEEEVKRKAEELVRKLMGEMIQNINYSISVSGDVVHNLEKLSTGFHHAQKAMFVSRNVFGKNPIQWYDVAKAYMQTASQTEEDEYNSAYNIKMVKEIQKYIENHFTDPNLSLASVAEVFYITEAYVSKLFKRVSGENFSKYIEKIRMEHAKILLQEEGKTIIETSAMVGYNSPQVFRRAWKRYFGGIPSGKL